MRVAAGLLRILRRSLIVSLAVPAVLVPLAVLLAATPALADKRVALVVGNSAYRHVAPLDNPRNDARLMADTLRGLGFALIGDDAQLDLDKEGLEAAVQSFGDRSQGADVALFYFAGHGVQVRGANYLVPVGANPTKEADVDFQMLDTTLVLRQMESAGAKLNLLVLDACRNNPFGGRGLRATDSGLAQMRAPEGTLISFATQPGNVAQDGGDGNSPYTKALAQTIKRPGLDIFRAFNEVGLAVMQSTGNNQQPWLSSSPIKGEFYFSAPPTADASGPADDDTAWRFLNWDDPAALRRFLAEFPASRHAREAEALIAGIERDRAAARANADATAAALASSDAARRAAEAESAAAAAALARSEDARRAAEAEAAAAAGALTSTRQAAAAAAWPAAAQPPPPTLLEGIGRLSRWATGSAVNCTNPRSFYLLELGAGSITWRNGLGNTDVESVVASDESEFRTTTRTSVHVDNKNERVGQTWTYSRIGTDRIKVTPGGKNSFLLAPCP